jgi:hypothetical protein
MFRIIDAQSGRKSKSSMIEVAIKASSPASPAVQGYD